MPPVISTKLESLYISDTRLYKYGIKSIYQYDEIESIDRLAEAVMTNFNRPLYFCNLT